MRRTLRRLAGFLMLALGCLGLFLYLARDPVRDALGHAAAAWVARSLHGTVTVGTLRGSLVSSLVVRDLLVRDRQGVPVVQIAEARLRYDLLALLAKRLVLHEVQLVRPSARLSQAPDGSWNLAALLPAAAPVAPPAAGLPLALAIERLQIHDGTLDLQAPAWPGVQHVADLQLEGHGEVAAQRFQLHLARFRARAAPAGVLLHTLQGSVYGQDGTLRLEGLRLETEQTLVTGAGVLPGGAQAADLVLHLAPVDLADLGRLWQRADLYGPLALNLRLQGPPQAFEVQAQMQAGPGTVHLEASLDTQATPWRYQGQLAVQHVDLATLLHREALQSDLNLRLQVRGAGFELSTWQGRVQFEAQPSHLGSLTLSPSQVVLKAADDRLQVERCELHTSFGHLTAAGVLESSGTSALHYDLKADLATLRALVDNPTLAGTLRAQGDVQGAGAALQAQGVLQAHQLRYGDVQLDTVRLTYHGSQLGTQPQLTAQLTAQQAQLSGLPVERLHVDMLYAPAAQQLQLATEVQQSATAGGTMRSTLHWSETQQTLVLHELLVQLAEHAWRLESPATVVRETPGWRLERLVLQHAEERLALAGSFDGVEQIAVQVQLSQLDVTFLQRLFSLPAQLQGRAALHAHLAGSSRAPRLEAALTWQPEAPHSAPGEQLHATLTYAEHLLHGDVRLRQGTRELLSLEAHLPVDLALTSQPLVQRLLPSPVALQLRLKQPDLTALSRWQPAWPGLSGAVEAEMQVRGTYAALALEATGRLQQFGLQGRVQQVQAPIQLQATLGLLAARPTDQPPATSVTLQPHLHTLVLRLPSLRGQFSGQEPIAFQMQQLVAQASGHWTEAGLEGVLESLQAQVTVGGLPRAEVALAGRLSSQRLDLTRLQARWPRSEIQGSGTMTLPQHQLQVRLALPRLRLDELGLAPPAPFPAFVRGVIEARGTVTAPQLETRLHYAGGQLAATLTANFQEALPRYSATLRLDHLEAAAFLPGTQGTLQASVQAQGAGFTAPQRRAEVDMRLETSHLSLAPGLTARLKGRLAGAVVRLEDFQLRSAPLTASASGTLALTPGEKTALIYAVTTTDLTPLQPYLGTLVQAPGSLNGSLQGTWPTWQARSRLHVRDWTYGGLSGQRLQADLTLSQFPKAPQATVKAQVTDLHSATVPASSLTLQGTYNTPQGTVQMQVTSGPYQKTALDGRFTLATEQRLTVTRLHLQHNGLAWDNATPLTVVRSAAGRLEMQRLLLRSGRQEISAQGILIPDGPIEAQVQLQRLQLRPHVQIFAPALGPTDGSFSLQLAIRGTINQPLVEGVFTAEALRWQQRDVGALHGQWRTVGSAVQLDVRWQEQARLLLQVAGTVETPAPHRLDLRVQATELDLALVPALSPAVTHSTGRLNLDVRLTGTVPQPAFDGALEVRDGTVQLAATGLRYTKVQTHIVFTGSRVDITRFQAASGEGTLELTAWATYTGRTLTYLECLLQAQAFALMHTPQVEALLSAAVTLRGSWEDLQATGTLTLPRVRAQVDGKLFGSPDVVQPEELTVERVYGAGPQPTASQEVTPESRQKPVLSFLRADLRLELPQNAWVRGPGTAIELRGVLHITKDLDKPFVLRGSVETVRGFASFYSGKFTLERGRIDFTGSPAINPVLDVVATREVSGHVVAVNITGRAKAPQLHLSSTPELQQADIVTLLVVGKTTDRLTASERSGLSSQAQQIVGNVAAGELEQLLAKPLGFDTVDIQTGPNLTSSKVSVGRYITQDLFLSYEQQLGEESGNKIGVEYSVNRHLKLKGSSTNKGAAALDLLWRIDY